MSNLISFAGIFVLMAIAWLLSSDRRVINWRVVIWGTVLQLVFALFIFVLPAGSKAFLIVNDAVVRLLDSATAGTRFLFARLALPPGTRNEAGEESLGFFLAFQALPTIIFFASLMAGLYYIGIMPRLIRLFARVFTRLMRISGAESLSVSSNIFVGVEANMTVLPYLGGMTRSELCTILAAGMSTTASSVLALYVFILQEKFPAIAGHLVSASIISAVAAIVMSKLILPESARPETLGRDIAPYCREESTLMEAVINGANEGVKMVVGIVACALYFLLFNLTRTAWLAALIWAAFLIALPLSGRMLSSVQGRVLLGAVVVLVTAAAITEHKFVSRGNALLVIEPYRLGKGWAFDEPRLGLRSEPFVQGIPEIIDKLVAGIPGSDKSVRLIFSQRSFPGAQLKLERRREQDGGNWYYCRDYRMEGWLCPALFKYFPRAPQNIYVKAEEK